MSEEDYVARIEELESDLMQYEFDLAMMKERMKTAKEQIAFLDEIATKYVASAVALRLAAEDIGVLSRNPDVDSIIIEYLALASVRRPS